MDKSYQKANRPVKKLSLKSNEEWIVPVRVKRIVCLHVLYVMEIKAFTFKIPNAQTFNNDNIRQNLQVKTVAGNYTSIYFTRVSKVKMLLSQTAFLLKQLDTNQAFLFALISVRIINVYNTDLNNYKTDIFGLLLKMSFKCANYLKTTE